MAPTFVENSFGHWVKIFITFGISRCAVPLFFMFAAFLQAKKNDSYLVLLKKRAKSLLLPYVLWMSLLAFFYGGLKLIVARIAPQFLGQPENTCLTGLFWIGSTRSLDTILSRMEVVLIFLNLLCSFGLLETF